MMDEQDLRERFDAVPVPVSRLDARGLADAGRRRVRRRRAIGTACGAALAAGLLVAVPSLVFGGGGGSRPEPVAGHPQAVKCPVAVLPVPAGMTNVQPVAVDPTGRYIIGDNITGYRNDGKSGKAGMPNSQAVLWTDGQPQALPLVAGKNEAVSAVAVNAGGVVVAIAGSKAFDTVVRYVGGTPVKLGTPAGKWTFQGGSVNTAGDILVTAYHGDSMVGATALLWKAGSTTATRLPLPAGADVTAITDAGTLVGTLTTGPTTADIAAYVWDQHGQGRKLKVPAGQHGAVNAARGDWAAGNLWDSGTAVRWNLTTGAYTDLGIHGPADSVNGDGWLISDSTVQRDDAKVELATVNGVKGEPRDMSDTGVVVGSILVADSQGGATSQGVLRWQCPN
jgi:hypothetical protein